MRQLKTEEGFWQHCSFFFIFKVCGFFFMTLMSDSFYAGYSPCKAQIAL